MSFSLDTRLSVAPKLSIADLGGEAVALDPVSGEYFGLNEVAARILDIASEGASVAQVIDRLLTEFEVTRDQLIGDVNVFVNDLERHGLITTSRPE